MPVLSLNNDWISSKYYLTTQKLQGIANNNFIDFCQRMFSHTKYTFLRIALKLQDLTGLMKHEQSNIFFQQNGEI